MELDLSVASKTIGKVTRLILEDGLVLVMENIIEKVQEMSSSAIDANEFDCYQLAIQLLSEKSY